MTYDFRNDETSREPEEDRLVRELLKEVASDEIKKQALEFVKKFMPVSHVICDVCGATNCKYNTYCIKCNCQF